MRDFLLLLITFWLTTFFLPWWALLVSAFLLGAVMFKINSLSFITGFGAGFTAWGLQVLYVDITNHSVLSSRIAELLGVGQSWLVILFTALIGGIMGALGTLLGTQIRLLIKPARQARSIS